MAKKVKELIPAQQAANSYIDITKIGPLGYRQLQAANADPNSEYEKIMNLGAAQTAAMYDNIVPRYTNTPAQLGQSIYDDEVVGGYEYENLNEIRAQRQPWYAKLSAGVAKGAVLAGTTFLDGTLGLAMGIGAAVDKGDASQLWDNPFSRLMQQINEESEKLMPNYYTKAEQEGPWYENILSANFIGDKLIKNLGFTVGAFYSGNVFSNLLKATKIPQLIGVLSKSVQAPKHIISSTGAVLSAINEGRIEALNNSNDWFQYQKQQLDDIYSQKFQALQDTYGSTEMYNSMAAQLQDDYNKSLAKINEDRTKMGNADLLMNLPILTASNIIQFGKLYGNGFKTARKTNSIYGKLGELKTSATEHINRKAILKGLGRAISEGAEEIEQKAASVIAGKAYEQDLNNYYAALSEPQAVDETINWGKAFSQGLLETLGESGTWEEGFIGTLTGALGMPIFRGIRNQEGKLQSPITIEGGIRGAFQEQKAQARREQEIVDYANSRVKDPKFQNLWKHLVRHKFYDSKMDQAVENNDEFDYKNNEDSQLINDIEMFDSAGKLDDLKALVQSGIDLSDEDIQQLIDDTSTESTINEDNINTQISDIQDEINNLKLQKKHIINLKSRKNIDKAIKKKESQIQNLQKTLQDNSGSTFYIGPFIDENGNKKSVEEVRKKIQENAQTILKDIDVLTNLKDKIDVRTNEQLTDDQLSTLTYLGMKSNSWKGRNAAMFDEIQSFVANTEGLEGVKNGIELGQKLKENPNLKEALKNTINSQAEDALDAQTYTGTVDDIIKTSDGVLDFNRKLEEYLNNPQKITEQNQRVDQQRVREQQAIDEMNLQNEIDGLRTFGEVDMHQYRDQNDQGILQHQGLYNKSNNPVVRDFNKAVRFRSEVNQAIDNSDYDDQDKHYLKELMDSRFHYAKSYDELTDPNEDIGEQITRRAEGLGLSEFIQIANDNIAKNPTKQQSQVNTNNIPQVPTDTTGNDQVGTTPPQTQQQQEIKGLSDLLNSIPINISADNAQEFSNTINKLKEDTDIFKQVVESAFKIKTNNENALNTTLKELSKLRRKYNDLNQGEEFNQKADDFFNQIEERIKSKLYSIDKSNSQDNIADIQLDNTSQSDQKPEKTGEPKEYLRSDLTEFTIDSFNDGTLERFADKYPQYKDVWNKIAFDYINKGNVKVGDTIELRLEPTESNGQTYETVYMYHNGVIVGVLPREDRTEYKGIQDIYKLLRDGKQLKTTVSQVMLGKFPYTRLERRPLYQVKGVNGAANVKLGIMTRGGMVTNDKQLDDNTENVYDVANATGKVYMLLKNSRGKLSPKRVIVKRFNNQEFPLIALKDSGNPIAVRLFNLIDQATKAIIDGIETNNMDKAFNAMDSLYSGVFKDLVLQGFHMDLMQNPQDGSIYLQFRVGDRRDRVNIAEIHDGRAIFNLDQEQLFNTILNKLNDFNPVFNINAKKINNPQYNKEIIESGLLETYISDSQMVGSWFTTNYLDANGNEQQANKVKGTFTPPSQYSSRTEVTDANGKQYTFYVYSSGETVIYSRETNAEVTWDQLNPVVQELYRAEITYGNTMNGVNQINGVLLIERDGKKYALDRNRKIILNKDATDRFIEQLNKKNNPQIQQTQSQQQILPTQPNIHQMNVTIETNKDGKKEANMPIPKELQGIAKKQGSLQIDDVQYPIIIIDRPNGEFHNYSILLPNGKETDFGVSGFTNAPKEVSPLSVLTFITSPQNVGEAIQTFKNNLTLNQPIQTQSQQKQQQTIDLDAMANTLDTNVHNVPINNTPQTQPEVKSDSQPQIQGTQNIDLSYDSNIETLQLLLITREQWEDMSDDAKLSTLAC